MPLASVVQYFNKRLPELHPHAHLSSRARLHYHNGCVTALIAGFTLIPRQVPVLVVATGEVFAWSARFLAESDAGRLVIPETLYVNAWDGDDVIFLDRFLRTFHALHHLSLGADRGGLLAVDVHLRHMAALPEQHGQVYEVLLRRLGLSPHRLVLRLSGTALQHDPHVREAAASFSGRGYGLLAGRLHVGDTNWELLRTVGVQWATPAPAPAPATRVGGNLWDYPEDWARQAKAHGIGLWLDGVDSPEAIARARTLGVDLIEGALWDPVYRTAPAAFAGPRPVETP